MNTKFDNSPGSIIEEVFDSLSERLRKKQTAVVTTDPQKFGQENVYKVLVAETPDGTAQIEKGEGRLFITKAREKFLATEPALRARENFIEVGSFGLNSRNGIIHSSLYDPDDLISFLANSILKELKT